MREQLTGTQLVPDCRGAVKVAEFRGYLAGKLSALPAAPTVAGVALVAAAIGAGLMHLAMRGR